MPGKPKLPTDTRCASLAAKWGKNKDAAIMNYIDNNNKVTSKYPYNPNGSKNGATAFTNLDGRITIMMPHPERLFYLNQFSYKPSDWMTSPWENFFMSAREWVK